MDLRGQSTYNEEVMCYLPVHFTDLGFREQMRKMEMDCNQDGIKSEIRLDQMQAEQNARPIE